MTKLDKENKVRYVFEDDAALETFKQENYAAGWREAIDAVQVAAQDGTLVERFLNGKPPANRTDLTVDPIFKGD